MDEGARLRQENESLREALAAALSEPARARTLIERSDVLLEAHAYLLDEIRLAAAATEVVGRDLHTLVEGMTALDACIELTSIKADERVNAP